ncbi:hypothetical protein BCAR13_280038 [Paraburkholderia caribensis]|nr:hypothetical protein BCAR13_280038 [Paraburkholderia caribensis]
MIPHDFGYIHSSRASYAGRNFNASLEASHRNIGFLQDMSKPDSDVRCPAKFRCPLLRG